MRQNGNGTRRHPDEILAEIEQTRHQMDSTLGAIEERLTPGQLLDKGMDYLRHSGAADYVKNLRGSVTTNPLPIALVGVGLAWLAIADKVDRSRGDGIGTSFDTGGARDQASGALHKASDALHGTASSMKERASSAMSSGRETLDQTARMAREGVEAARGSYDRIVQEQPLALGAIGLAIGAVLAAAIPSTRKEEELMAGTREKIADKASELTRETMEKGKEKVQQAKQAVHAQQPVSQKPSSPPQGERRSVPR